MGKTNLYNIILGVLLIIILLFIGEFFLDRFMNIIIFSWKELSKISSSLDQVVIVAIITGFLTLIGVFLREITKYKNSKKQYLDQKREIYYVQFMELYVKLGEDKKMSDKNLLKELREVSKGLMIWGSKSVVKKWLKYKEEVRNDKRDKSHDIILVEDIMNEMRKDLGVGKVKRKQLISLFINDPENIK